MPSLIRKISLPTLNFYLMRSYILNFFMLLIGLLAIIYLFDTVELLRRAAKIGNIPISLTLTMGLYKLPEVGQLVFPFAVLFSAMLTFWQLARRHELVILRSSGLSVWQFLTPVVLSALLIGLVSILLINPLGAFLITQYKNLENDYLERKSSLITLSEQGLWLRQEHEEGTAILHSGRIKMPEWALENVMVIFFSGDHDFLRRIDAPRATLSPGQWNFEGAVSNMPGDMPQQADFLSMATDLTTQDLEKSFSAPETVSFWKMPAYIQMLEQTGFDSARVKIHYQGLLAQPLLFMAMVLLAASVSLRPPRLRGTSMLIVAGIFIGFIVFFSSSFLQALGASGQIPILVAAWFPAFIAFLMGIGAMMVLEDG
ncbi:MAG: LPS export ABC transporter permease LptG [Alphaproteobacteria bacterium]|nr:LPS export ABC transporter permease LptG [Alphaproteobacteria bacterium]